MSVFLLRGGAGAYMASLLQPDRFLLLLRVSYLGLYLTLMLPRCLVSLVLLQMVPVTVDVGERSLCSVVTLDRRPRILAASAQMIMITWLHSVIGELA
jgi:hypothetical protein